MTRHTRLVQPVTRYLPGPVWVVRIHPAAIFAAECLCGPDQHVELNKDGSAMVVNNSNSKDAR